MAASEQTRTDQASTDPTRAGRASTDPMRDPGPHAQDRRQPGEARIDSWTIGRARLVAFKADRLLSAAQRELGSFGEATLSADLAPDLLEASERVGEALAVLARFQERLRAAEAPPTTPDGRT